MDNRPIGIFDSGVGGLTVVKEIVKSLPNENIVYFGDTARVPYGAKSKDVVTKYSKQIVRFLMTKNVKAIIQYPQIPLTSLRRPLTFHLSELWSLESEVLLILQRIKK